MPRLRVHNFTITLDGYGAGKNQREEAPLGDGMDALHDWVFKTKGGQAMLGQEAGEEGLDNDYFHAGETGIGATIMGRNMFGPVRGPWPDESWKGWWGNDPPYHHPVFVLTHFARPSLAMDGGTTFHFVNESPEVVLQRAFEAARGHDVRLGGGVGTVQQFLKPGLIDEMHIAIAPVLAGAGERLFENLGGALAGYECSQLTSSGAALHALIVRRAGP